MGSIFHFPPEGSQPMGWLISRGSVTSESPSGESKYGLGKVGSESLGKEGARHATTGPYLTTYPTLVLDETGGSGKDGKGSKGLRRASTFWP